MRSGTAGCPVGHKLNPAELLFSKIEDAEIDKQVARLEKIKAERLAAERVPKTDKLLKLTINTGLDQRTIVSGIAKF